MQGSIYSTATFDIRHKHFCVEFHRGHRSVNSCNSLICVWCHRFSSPENTDSWNYTIGLFSKACARCYHCRFFTRTLFEVAISVPLSKSERTQYECPAAFCLSRCILDIPLHSGYPVAFWVSRLHLAQVAVSVCVCYTHGLVMLSLLKAAVHLGRCCCRCCCC